MLIWLGLGAAVGIVALLVWTVFRTPKTQKARISIPEAHCYPINSYQDLGVSSPTSRTLETQQKGREIRERNEEEERRRRNDSSSSDPVFPILMPGMMMDTPSSNSTPAKESRQVPCEAPDNSPCPSYDTSPSHSHSNHSSSHSSYESSSSSGYDSSSSSSSDSGSSCSGGCD